MNSYGYEVLVQPALYLAAFVAVLVALFRGSARNTLVDAEGVTTKGKFTLKVGARRRAAFTALAAALILPALVITPPGHRAAIYNLGGGVNPIERGEGLSLVFPYVQTARMVSVRSQVYQVEVFPQSFDLQEITVPVAVNYHIDPAKAAELYRDVGLNYQVIEIAPAVDQFVTQEVGLFLAGDFAGNRAKLAEAVFGALADRLELFGIVVESVNLRDAIFSAQFVQDNANKVSADLKAIEAERLVAVAVANADAVRATAAGDRDAAIAKAEGQRQAIVDVAAALGFTPTEYLRWIMLSAWNGALPSTLVGDAGEFGLLLTPDSPVAP
jgi:regulator of protease activity HflC (stomatin/prohibitin superfamily)